jgi:outer membrane protein TolC
MYKFFLITLLIGTNIFANIITFDDAYDKTIQNNKSLKAKKIDLQKGQIDLKNAKSYNYGTITFNENIAKTDGALNVFGMKLMSREADFGSFGFSEFDNTNPNILKVQPEDLNNPDARTNYETKVSYDLPLFTGFKLQSAKEISKLQIKAHNARYNYDKKQLGLEVLKAYNGAVAAKYFIDATKEAKKATMSFVNFASEMHKEGYITNIDVKQAQVYDMKINSMMIETQNKYALAIEYLKFLTNDYTISDVAGFVTINTDNIDTNINSRDDYKWMSANTATMKKKIDFTKSTLYPMVGIHLEYGFNDDKLNNLSKDKDYYVGAIGLEYKIFDGFKTSNDIQKAKLEYMQTKHYLDYMKEGITLEITKAKLTLKTKKSILLQTRKALVLAKEVLEQSHEMYKNQLLKMSDLLMQEASYQKAKAQVIKARYDLSIASANLQLAVGNNIKGEK